MLQETICEMYLASNMRGVEGHFVVSVVVTAFESAPTATSGTRASNASTSIHILPEPRPGQEELLIHDTMLSESKRHLEIPNRTAARQHLYRTYE